jgi:single-stranded DNA-binding protein
VADYSSKADDSEPMWIDIESWNGLAERVLNHVTEGREVVVTGRLSISKYTKEINGVKIEMRHSVVKLSGFHLCGPKPKSEDKQDEVKSATKRSKATA